MNANEAPEKIYIPTILSANTVRYKKEGSIEYTHTDAFIEKACDWIRFKRKTYRIMKELTIEEKAKAYDEAIKRARNTIEVNQTIPEIVEWVESLFPELKESEDEKVRNTLVEMVHDTTGDELWVDYNVHKEEALAWLEKQGDSPIKWYKNTKDYKPQKNHSVLMKTTHGIAEGEWNGEHWIQYRWSSSINDSDVLSWIELSDLGII